MTSRPSRFPAAAKRRRPAKIGSGPVAMIVASLFAAAVFFQPPAHSAGATPANASAEAAVARSSDSATRVAELEKGFWICDYLGTNQGADTQQAATCIANFEEFKQTKSVAILKAGDVVAAEQDRTTQSAGVQRLRAVLSTQSIGANR